MARRVKNITCTDCNEEKLHFGRGLCGRCYDRHQRGGTLIDFPLAGYPAEELLTEWEILRSEGHSVRQAAERLGMKYATFDKALQRAQRRGDPRAARPHTKFNPHNNQQKAS